MTKHKQKPPIFSNPSVISGGAVFLWRPWQVITMTAAEEKYELKKIAIFY